jgi:hypothetical protein
VNNTEISKFLLDYYPLQYEDISIWIKHYTDDEFDRYELSKDNLTTICDYFFAPKIDNDDINNLSFFIKNDLNKFSFLKNIPQLLKKIVKYNNQYSKKIKNKGKLANNSDSFLDLKAGYSVFELKKKEDLEYESSAMQHCVGQGNTYYDRIKRGVNCCTPNF